MSIEDYGNFAVSIKVLAVLCALLTVAKQFSLTIYMPQFEKSHKYIQKNGIVLWLSKNLFISTIILLSGIAAAWGAFYLVNNETFILVFQNSPFHFILFFLPILTLFIVLSCLGLSQQSFNKMIAPFLTVMPNFLVITVFILGLYTLNTSTFSTILLYFICQGVILLIYLFLSNIFYAPTFATGYSVNEHEYWYTRSSAYWMSTFSNQISVVISLFALEFLAPESYVGEYAVILLFVVSYNALISPLHTYLASQLGMVLETNTKKVTNILSMINRLQIIIVILAVISTILFSNQALGYLNIADPSLYFMLIIAMILFGVAVVTSLPIRILLHSNLRSTAFALKSFRLIGCVLLLSFLVPFYGILGAILSDTIPLIITNFIGLYICRHNLKFNALTLE